MPILTYIDGIPLYTTKSEAISWGAQKNPKIFGYHTHEYDGVIGYMAGYVHSTNMTKDYDSDFYRGVVSEADDLQKLSDFYTNITIDHQKSRNTLEAKYNTISDGLNEVSSYPSGSLNDIQQKAIDDYIAQLNELLESLKLQIDKNKKQLDYIRSLNINEFGLYLQGREVAGKPAELPIVFDPKQEAELVIQAVNEILNNNSSRETVRVNDVKQDLPTQTEDVRTPQSSRY